MRIAKVATALAGALLLACGKDAVDPPPRPLSPALRIIAGGSGSDTVDAILQQALVVEVQTPQGTRAGVPVRFATLNPSDKKWLQVSALSSTTFVDTLAESTGASGRASAIIRLGDSPGTGRVVVSVPDYGLADTLSYAVALGTPAFLYFDLLQGFRAVGESFPLSATAIDRRSRLWDGPIMFVPVSDKCSVQGNVATLTAIGRCQIEARAGSLRDTAEVSVIPDLDVVTVVRGGPRIVLVRRNLLDTRSDTVGFTDNVSHQPLLRPNGLLAYESSFRVGVRLSNGITQYPMATGFWITQHSPRLDADGSHVFFVGESTSSGIYRVSVNRQNLTQIFQLNDITSIDLSPDASQIVLSRLDQLFIVNADGSGFRALGTTGSIPRWSPTGEWIVYRGSLGVRLIRPDGTGDRQIAPTGFSYLDWLPDGKWVVLGDSPVLLVATDSSEVVYTNFGTGIFRSVVR